MCCETVAVGLSGGVDSAAAALLLKRAGYRVLGITMRQDDRVETEDARRVAEALEIPCHLLDLRREFREYVQQYFAAEYLAGRTPNPCTVCNRTMKWGALLEGALALGADRIATGHYARVLQLPNGRFALKKADSVKKDQTYALYGLTQPQLARTLMPLAGLAKPEVRRLVAEAGLPVADKGESQDICFVPDGDYGRFIEELCGKDRMPAPGNFVLTDGRVVGRHKGIIHYTVGQRRGLGIAWSEPLFVKEILPATDTVVLGTADTLLCPSLYCEDINWMAVEAPRSEMRLTVKIRYNHPGAAAVVCPLEDGRVQVLFDEPVRAVTPGQAAVFYDGDLVVGGGTIIR